MPDLSFLNEFTAGLAFPQEAREALSLAAWRIRREEDLRFRRILLPMQPQHDSRAYREAFSSALGELNTLAEDLALPACTVNMVALIDLFRPLRGLYRKEGLSDGLYRSLACDLRYKLLECREVYGLWGTFVPAWFSNHLALDLFSLGRFQYQPERLHRDLLFPDGRFVPAGSFMMRIHIPSDGQPLSDELRLDSYRRAVRFFAGDIGSGPALFTCESWLLNPAHREMLPDTMNIRRFMDDFTLLTGFEEESFHDAWRVFGSASLLPLSEWPEDTTLRRAYVKRLREGGRSGRGEGFFLFE